MQNWSKVEVVISRNLHVSPLDVDKMDFYRVENYLTAYEEIIDEENKNQLEEQKKYEKQQSQLPQSNYGGYQVPKVEIPKMNIPNIKVP